MLLTKFQIHKESSTSLKSLQHRSRVLSIYKVKNIKVVPKIANLAFYLGIAALFTHEMDAVINFEWRLLFHLRTLEDTIASRWFVALHFPIFLAVMLFSHHPNLKLRSVFRFSVCLFLMVHSALHFWLSDHSQYQFNGLLSNLYIYASGALGLIYLLMLFIANKSNFSK